MKLAKDFQFWFKCQLETLNSISLFTKKGAQYRPHFDSFDYETEDGKNNWEPKVAKE